MEKEDYCNESMDDLSRTGPTTDKEFDRIRKQRAQVNCCEKLKKSISGEIIPQYNLEELTFCPFCGARIRTNVEK